MFHPKANILVVDDEPELRELIVESLAELGLKNVTPAKHGKEALFLMEWAAKFGGTFDLVICDRNMPEMSGVELLAEMRAKAHLKDVPFLMVTGDTNPHHVAEAAAIGIGGYLLKPFDIAGLAKKLEALAAVHGPVKTVRPKP